MNQDLQIQKSEIINQKKNFIFDVEPSSTHVFPYEELTFYIYIKNISGSNIEDFVINIENPENVEFTQVNEVSNPITLKSNEIKLYEIKATCLTQGVHIINFVGYGKGTSIALKTLKIRCNYTYNSDKLTHRISIYDFTPYEETYSLEADNYSSSVTQIFKRQKLPYKAGKQPFSIQKNFTRENIESESLIKQLDIKNTNEHVYQYISRENFIENATEVFEGHNLFDIINDINKNSQYFNASFIRTGTNTLLNDFTQYEPNGFIYRFGLLSSEIYHALGVIPTYSYMSDKLFRWAPSKSGYKLFMSEKPNGELIDLYPKQKAMQWGKNVWAGSGWFVYKVVTDEYKETEEFKTKRENHLIEERTLINSFEHKESAKTYIKYQEDVDAYLRYRTQSDIVKFKYILEESLYEPGVFFVNIPIDKIPSNFYLLDNDSLSAIIERAKPFGMKPVINYVIEVIFKQNMEQILHFNPAYNILFEHDAPRMKYRVQKNKIQEVPLCDGVEGTILQNTVIEEQLHEDYCFNIEANVLTRNPDVTVYFDKIDEDIDNSFKHNIQQEVNGYKNSIEKKVASLNDIIEMLYQKNNENFSFSLIKEGHHKVNGPEAERDIDDKEKSILFRIGNRLPFENNEEEIGIVIKDNYNKKYRFTIKYNPELKLDVFKYTYINIKGKETVKQIGAQKNITALVAKILPYKSKEIIIFFVEDTNNRIHYFNHVVIQEAKKYDVYSNKGNKYYSKVELIENNIYTPIQIETPFVYTINNIYPKETLYGNNWENLYRLNNHDNSYTLIESLTKKEVIPDDVLLHYENLNIPDTAIVKNLRLKINGYNTKNKQVYISKALQTNHYNKNSSGNTIQIRPESIECYQQPNESIKYYQYKLQQAQERKQTSLVEDINKKIDENILFDEILGFNTSDYMNDFDSYITITNNYWIELSDFLSTPDPLNEIESIDFVIEGYNSSYETELEAQTTSETTYSTIVKEKIPAGYFKKEVSLLFPNKLLLELFRVKFRFNRVDKKIKIFNTSLNVNFKNNDGENIDFEYVDTIQLDGTNSLVLLSDYIYPDDINNGVDILLSFDSIEGGEYYHINSAQLEVLYEDTDTVFMLNENKYNYISHNGRETTITCNSEAEYISGEFYNDVTTVTQIKSNIGPDNHGIKLKDAIYQSFEVRSDNITSIEVFQNGFIGNPDETIKIGIYENTKNSPGMLIKEIYANGWVKHNEELKALTSIKYNINVSNLKPNQTYWFKMEVLNPQENNYYLLKSINDTQPNKRLLIRENNNYINTFSCLEFNIYSRNLSRTFPRFPAIQEFFNNPYILIGLHKNKGYLKDIELNQYYEMFEGEDLMKESFDGTISLANIKICETRTNINTNETVTTILVDDTIEEEE